MHGYSGNWFRADSVGRMLGRWLAATAPGGVDAKAGWNVVIFEPCPTTLPTCRLPASRTA